MNRIAVEPTTSPAAHSAESLPTYYGRPQLKPAPFEKIVVGGYIFLAGLSGASAVLAAIADRSSAGEGRARRGRYLSLLAMTVGPPLLIYDLHTPQRFYNMLRIVKRTSPMSIGTWILMTFSCFAGLSAAAQFLHDHIRGPRWMRAVARASQLPAAAAGAGLTTYTASLLSATSTPAWAAAPQALAVRFGASSVASAAAALSFGERSEETRRKLDDVACVALVAETIATVATARAYRKRGVTDASDHPSGALDRIGAVGLGIALPLGLYAAARLAGGNRSLSTAASLATLAGSLLLRISTLSAGKESAKNPKVSLRFSQPSNLPTDDRLKLGRTDRGSPAEISRRSGWPAMDARRE